MRNRRSKITLSRPNIQVVFRYLFACTISTFTIWREPNFDKVNSEIRMLLR